MANRLKAKLLVDGSEIVDSNILNECIEHGSMSIDGQKLQGFDNMIIDERRAKVSIKLLNNNQSFNGQLKQLFTDNSMRLPDLMPTVNIPTWLFDYGSLKNLTSDTNLWNQYFNDPDNQSWNYEYNLFPQSKTMLDIFYTMFETGIMFSSLTYNAEPIGFPMIYTGIYTRYKLFKQTYNVNGYRFNYGYPNLISFLARGLQIENDLGVDTSIDDVTNAFIEYLNSFTSTGNLGDSIESYLNSIEWYEDETLSLSMLFIPRIGVTNLPQSQIILYQVDSINILDHIIYYIENYTNFDYWMGATTISDFATMNQNQKRAFFFASILKYEWYSEVKSELASKNNDPMQCRLTGMPSLNNLSYVPLFNAREVVQRRDFNNINYNHTNIFWNILLSTPNIEYLQPILDSATGIRFGTPQRQSLDEQTESGIPISLAISTNDQSMYDDEELLVPVTREYRASSNDFATISDGFSAVPLLCDNINFSEIYGTPSDNYFYLGQFETNNWMYFDNIKCIERYSPYLIVNNEARLYYPGTDLIPVYNVDETGQTDEYGLFIYKDFFNNYYSKQPSNLTKIELKIYNEQNEAIYTGIVDYSSVNITKTSINFSTTDAIGLLIENLGKLNEFVYLSQFNIKKSNIADLRAGTNIYQLLNYLTGTQMLPYDAGSIFQKQSIVVGDIELQNKLLDKLSPQECLVVAVQKSKKLLTCDGNGLIYLTDIPDVEELIEIDYDEIISYSSTQGIDTENFDVGKLKLLSGYESWLAGVVSSYAKYRHASRSVMNVEIFTEKQIKMLDKIAMLGKEWNVISIEYGRSINVINIQAIER